ncbi:phenylalanine--tRNA ligase subunit beta [Patescibacteria group bacterium]|nr:phenylalanine--tRNA ligase subunit beta [Patescibacteria group bacterium]MBU1673497.1 phenylalanine--tRNA ligase subunit beta [Patescibacteria group bacterium]MBU1963757.1 phenylalanine--tRNA ligase subunit beta [Patescibacteria group bacterium]
MNLSYNWLKQYIALPPKPEKVADDLTMHTAEVDEVRKLGENLDEVVVGLVESIEKHPNADKLLIAQIKIGPESKQIVCGDLDLSERQYVAFAKVGAKVKWHGEDDWTNLEEAEIRGEKSFGMACAGAEIGLSDKMEVNVIDLKKDYGFSETELKLGTPLNKLLGMEDYLLDIDNKSLTHRSDLFSHIGFARELAAIYSKTVNLPKLGNLKAANKVNLKVEVKDKELCPRYMGIVLEDIRIEESPEWMQKMLVSYGMRPINNVVDITNFVMLEYGQPMHAFDLEKLATPKIIVRPAIKGEEIITIDDQKRKLTPEDLIIADEKGPIAIAGVMGGATSEVSDKTTTLILESANFNKTSVRKTSNRLALRTEAVLRFEKGLSAYLPEEAMLRAVDLLKEYAGAKEASALKDEFKLKPKVNEVIVRNEYIYRLIGEDIKPEKVKQILSALGFIVKKTNGAIKVIAPNFRTDINIPEDVIEEVARIYGFDNITPKPIVSAINPPSYNPTIVWKRRIKEALMDLGFTQMMNYSFYGDKELRNLNFDPKTHIELANPLSEDQKYLRTTLLPGLLNNVERNLYIDENPKLFEEGHIYYPDNEMDMVGGVIVGDSEKVFFDAKGLVEMLLKQLNVDFEIRPIKERAEKYSKFWNIFNNQADTEIRAGDQVIGTLSLISPEILLNFNISGVGNYAEGKDKFVVYFNFWLDELVKEANNDKKYKPLPKYPDVSIDLSIIISEDIKWNEVEKEIKNVNISLREIELFDVYKGKSIPSGQKSFAMHLKFRDDSKTLEMDEVEKYRKEIMNKLNKQFKAEIRK